MGVRRIYRKELFGNRHLPKVGTIPLRGEFLYLLFNELLFFLCQTLKISCSKIRLQNSPCKFGEKALF